MLLLLRCCHVACWCWSNACCPGWTTLWVNNVAESQRNTSASDAFEHGAVREEKTMGSLFDRRMIERLHHGCLLAYLFSYFLARSWLIHTLRSLGDGSIIRVGVFVRDITRLHSTVIASCSPLHVTRDYLFSRTT